jgi:hypothetical protein
MSERVDNPAGNEVSGKSQEELQASKPEVEQQPITQAPQLSPESKERVERYHRALVKFLENHRKNYRGLLPKNYQRPTRSPKPPTE